MRLTTTVEIGAQIPTRLKSDGYLQLWVRTSYGDQVVGVP
ncbi:hypothetical protein BH23CHL5_BH23CHL5_11270 [soil metagenome]